MSKEFDYNSLTYENRQNVHDALAETTMKHIAQAPGLFTPLGFDPAASPSQMLETVHLRPAPASFEDTKDVFGIRTIATVAAPNLYPLVQETFSRQRAFISAARVILDNHTHIFPVTNHGNIADVAIWSAGWAEALEGDHWQDQNGLIISRGVTTIEAFDMAASEVVQKIGHVFMSFPRTETIDKLNMDKSLVDTNNFQMRAEVARWLREARRHRILNTVIGKSLHSAWSGKTDSVSYGDDHRLKSITMGAVSAGTIDIVKNGLVLPVAIWDGENPVLEIGELTKVENRSDVKRVQQWQSDTLASALGLRRDAVTVQ